MTASLKGGGGMIAPVSLWPWMMPSGMRPCRATWKEIGREVAAKYKLSLEDLFGRSTRQAVAHPRQEWMFRLRKELGFSYPKIGLLIGQRDYATARHGVRAHAKRIGAPVP